MLYSANLLFLQTLSILCKPHERCPNWLKRERVSRRVTHIKVLKGSLELGGVIYVVFRWFRQSLHMECSSKLYSNKHESHESHERMRREWNCCVWLAFALFHRLLLSSLFAHNCDDICSTLRICYSKSSKCVYNVQCM